MQVRIGQDAPTAARAGAIVVPVYSDGELTGAAKALDAALGGAIADIRSSGEIKGKLAEVSLLHAKDQPFHRVLIVGLGEENKAETHHLARLAGTAVRYLGRRGVSEIAIALPPNAKGKETLAASFIAEGAIAGTFDTTMYQAKPEKSSKVDTVIVLA